MNNYRRAHPASIVLNLGRVFYLLLIPVLRGVIAAMRGGFPAWLAGAWMDILVFLVMLVIAALIWFCVRFRCDGERLELVSGLLGRRELLVPWRRVSSVTVTRPFFLRLLGAAAFRADTPGGGLKKAELSILLPEAHIRAILAVKNIAKPGEFGKIHQPSTQSIVAHSLLTSNSFGGMIFISTLISQSGQLLGKEFSRRVIGAFENAARTLAFGAPPAAAAIAYALAAGWLIGFLLSFVRYKDFSLAKNGETLAISGGMLTRREYFIKSADVNFIDIRQSLVTRLLGLRSLYISAIGYGKRKDDISCVIPAEPAPRFGRSLKRVFPGLLPAPRSFAPAPSGAARFLGQPALCVLAVASAVTATLGLFPSWSGFIWFAGLMALVPALVFLAVRVIDFKSSGIAVRNGRYTLRYSKGLSLHTVVIPSESIVSVTLRQSVFQRIGPSCDVIIRSRAEGHVSHLCRGLVRRDMIKLFGLD